MTLCKPSKAYMGREVLLHSSLTSTVDRGEWSGLRVIMIIKM